MPKKLLLSLASLTLISAVLLAGCGFAAAPTASPVDAQREAGFAAEEPAMAPEVSSDMVAGGESLNSGAPVAQDVERLVIKNANLAIVVDDPGVEMKAIAAMAEDMGGFVVSSNLYQTVTPTGLEVPSASITVRVPAERLAEAQQTIEDRANSVTSSTESGQDVTSQYTDLQSRLRNLEDAEDLLRQIMDDARDTQDVLVAFNQLNSITEQIEVLKGQIKYYEESAAMSAISVQLTASAAAQPVTIGSWEPKGVALDAVRALIRALQGIANAAIWFVIYLLPILLIIAIPLWLIFLGIRRWRRKAKAS